MNVENSSLRRVPGTTVQIVGGAIRLKPIPDRAQQDWKGTIRGFFFNNTRETDRTSLQNIKDNNDRVTLTDGEHDGEYYILNLRWLDNKRTIATQRIFIMEIKQEQ